MILVDYRKGGSKDLDIPKLMVEHCRRIGVAADIGDLLYGDAAFEGKGPHGTISVGIERKSLHDLLNCIDDSRLSGHQLIGMKDMYDVRVLMVEGVWKPHDNQGLLMEGFMGGNTWGFCRYRSQRVMYAKMYRYLISVQLSGVIVSFSRDLYQTCFNICEWFHYFNKAWANHTSLLEVQKVAIPTLNAKPSLTLKWANDLEGIGVKLGREAERAFKKPIALAQADESEWMRIPGVGVATAQRIVREIWGIK